jgi:hypothetical protein
MRYLKLFEGFETDDYYVKIDEEKYLDLLGDDWVNERKVSKDVIDRLKKMGYLINKLPQTAYDPRSKFKSVFIYYGNKTARIYQLDDEYFMLELQPRRPQICYLCDQFEGLVKCIKDNLDPLLNKTMKHLGVFEGVEGVDNLYKEVSEDEYDELATSHVKFTTYEKEVIKKYFHQVSRGLVEVEERYIIPKEYFLISYNHKLRMAISKIDDEWFMVLLYEKNRYYKCDQIEGLKKLIEDILS